MVMERYSLRICMMTDSLVLWRWNLCSLLVITIPLMPAMIDDGRTAFRSISSSGAFPPYPAAGLVFIVRDQLNWNWILAEIVQISSTKQKFPPQNRRLKCCHWSDITIIIIVIVIVILRTPIAVPCSIVKYRSNTLRKNLFPTVYPISNGPEQRI